jgi:hypothetical protein
MKIKAHANWTDDAHIFNKLLLSTPNNSGKWKNIELTQGNDYDYFVIFNMAQHRNFDPRKAIIFQLETKTTRTQFRRNFSVDDFYFVYTTEKFHTVDVWYHSMPYEKIKTFSPVKTKTLSGIISDNRSLPGHNLRYNFLHHLNTLPFYEHYGKGKFTWMNNWRGVLTNKQDGLLDYKYTFNCENDFENNYFTEKILDGVFCECLTFYQGCPNIKSFINEECYVLLDLYKPEEALEIVKKTISDNEWEKRIDAIRKEKIRIVDELNPMNIIWKIVNQIGL